LGVSDCTEWLGEYRYEDMPDAIAQMDVLVLPSRTVPGKWKEQFGHVLIEAMSMGVPVVGSSSGAIPDVIGRDDLIFTEDQSDDLAEILEKLLVDQVYRAEVARYGLARIEQLYTNEALVRQLLPLFQALVGTGEIGTDIQSSR
jgi:glycosyltransferase involved in cell wall biosynthesis